MMYVVMDGFDLGIGILFPFVPRPQPTATSWSTRSRRSGTATRPGWCWAAPALLAAFPLAYSVLLSALYLPLVLMLLGLICAAWRSSSASRPTRAHRPFWDKAFVWGSYIAAFFQGVALGAFIDGFEVDGPAYAGGALDWLTPFSLFTGIGVVVAYALLGCTWLIMKTEGALQGRMIALARPIVPVLLVVIGVVSLWTPLAHPTIAARWFRLPNIFLFSPVPVLVLATCWQLMRC